MGLVSGLVDAADGMLTGVAESTFTTIVGAAGTTVAAMATLALVLVGVNIMVQYRPFHPGQVLVLAIKLLAISWVGLKWAEFYKIAGAVETAMNTIGGAILDGFSGANGSDGVASTLAASIDDFISDVATSANSALEPLSWMAGALLSVLVTLLLAVIGCTVGLALIFAKVMVTVYLSLAPIFIALWIFDATKDYFHRWVQSTVTYMLYPVVIAAVLGAIVRLVSAYISTLSTSVTGSISEFIPFIAALLVMIVVVAFIPYIVNSLAGSFAAPGPGAAAFVAKRMGSNVTSAASSRPVQAGVQQAQKLSANTAAGAKPVAVKIAERTSRY